MLVNADPSRIQADLAALADIVDPTQPPYTRRAFTDTFLRGREWLQKTMESASLQTRVDPGGNLIGRLSGRDDTLPQVMIGSHSDTVVGGGRYDGVAGVIAGIEVARVLRERGAKLRRPLEVVDFLSEEPSDYGVSCVGSRALVGNLSPDMLARTNSDGETLAEGIRRMGGDPDQLTAALRAPGSVHAYLELHIEQGPLLESRGLSIGIVTGIFGIDRYHVTFQGRADHAGTTPMNIRRDALVAASEAILAVNEVASRIAGEVPFVGTVGRLLNRPNNPNVVPSSVEITVELRCEAKHVVGRAWGELEKRFVDIADRRQVRIHVQHLTSSDPVQAGPTVVAALEEACAEMGIKWLRMASGAGHDAAQMALITQMGMVLVPCRDGRSHAPEEYADPIHIALGTDVLLNALIKLD